MLTALIGLITFPVFAESTQCTWVYSEQTGVSRIRIDWDLAYNGRGTIFLEGQNGTQIKFKVQFQSGAENTRCGRYSWKHAKFGSAEKFSLHLIKGGCPASNEHGNEIKFPALLDVTSWHGTGRDVFSCNNF